VGKEVDAAKVFTLAPPGRERTGLTAPRSCGTCALNRSPSGLAQWAMTFTPSRSWRVRWLVLLRPLPLTCPAV